LWIAHTWPLVIKLLYSVLWKWANDNKIWMEFPCDLICITRIKSNEPPVWDQVYCMCRDHILHWREHKILHNFTMYMWSIASHNTSITWSTKLRKIFPGSSDSLTFLLLLFSFIALQINLHACIQNIRQSNRKIHDLKVMISWQQVPIIYFTDKTI